MKLDFEYLKKEILNYKAKSEYKQASIVILRNIFKEAETKQCAIHSVVKQSEQLKSKERLDYKSWKKAMGYERLEKPVLKKGNKYVEVEKVMLEFDEYERTF